jgi:hypothetical protein
MELLDFRQNHKIGNLYSLRHRNGDIDEGWKVVYIGVNGTYKKEVWVEYPEHLVLVEKPMKDGIDLREVHPRYLIYGTSSE